MSLTVDFGSYKIDLNEPLDISLSLSKQTNVNAFHLPDPAFETVVAENFTGNVNQGGTCNVENIHLNAHGNGTHTECVGHISQETYHLKDILCQYHFLALLVSLPLEKSAMGSQLSLKALEDALTGLSSSPEALVVRSLPNDESKKNKVYSGTNPPFVPVQGISAVKEVGIQHLLVDLPSIDQESDPLLKAHHAFFDYPGDAVSHRTITELIYVPNHIPDGLYLLNLQVLAIESDASPSHPVLYRLM